jgi:hypothetical protein
MSRRRRRYEDLSAGERADLLKERIYLTFTALAVVIVIDSHGHVTAGDAMRTLAFTTAGTLLAVTVADVVAHLAAHARVLTGKELRHALTVALDAIGAVTLPFIFLVLALLDVWSVHSALIASKSALVAALVAIGWAAVRRVRLPWWQKLIALGGEAALGLAVIGLEILAHG